MDISRILRNYERFLRIECGGGDGGAFLEACERLLKKPGELISVSEAEGKAIAQGGVGLLSDEDVVALFAQTKGQDFIKEISIPVKVEELGALLTFVPFSEIASAVEFGSGPALLPIYLQKYNIFDWKMAVLDANQEFLNYGRKFSQSQEVEIEFIHSWANNSGLPDESYDLVFSIDLIDCSCNWRTIVREMARVAKKKVVILYGLKSEFRRIDPLEVALELSRSMLIDAPCCYESGTFDDGVIITASKVATDEDRGRIVLATTAMY